LRKLIIKFKYYKDKLINCKDDIKDAKRKINNLELLKILDNQIDVETRTLLRAIETILSLMFWLIVFTIFQIFYCNLIQKLGNGNTSYLVNGIYALFIINFFYLILRLCEGILFIVSIEQNSKIFEILKRFNWLANYYIFLNLTIWPLLFTFIFQAFILNKDSLKAANIVSLIAFIVSCLILIFREIIRSLPLYKIGNYSSTPAIVLSLLAIGISAFDFGKNIYKIEDSWYWLLFIFLMTFACTIAELIIKTVMKRKLEKAQVIFQEQLLLEKPDYKKLKRCYYYGGDEYKNKLLSVEKFLLTIVENEIMPLESLKNLNTYEKYLLYKSYMYRTYSDCEN